MSLSSGLIAAVALAYMAIMFAIAFYGDRRSAPLPPRVRAWVYSLSLAVYCTSWTFFGAVGQAAEQLWSFLPIYLGPILLLVGAPWVLQKMVMISKQENITSIADFIAARYGKSQSLAVVVALICLVGVLPYIALQLKGIVLGVNLLIGAGADAMGVRAQDTALIVSLVLALFTIVFGTRNLDATEHHRGMVLAIAFESLVKLFAFLAVGAYVTYGLYDGFDDLFDQAMLAPRLEEYWKETVNWPSMVVQTGVAMMAIICLPRQFHVTVVENIDPQDLRLAKWVFPAYLALAALFVVPIALAGQMLLPSSVLPDSFVISLPLAQAHPALALLAFIGGGIGGDRHGDRGQRGTVDHGLQRHAVAVAATPQQRRAPVRSVPPVDALGTPGEHRRHFAAGVRQLSLARLDREPGDHRPDRVRRSDPTGAGHAGRVVLETGQPPRRVRRPRCRDLPCGSTP